MDGFLQKLKGLDAYPKVNEDFYKRTLSGGVVTLLSALVMLLLFISETSKRASPPPSRRTPCVSWAVMARRQSRLEINQDLKIG